MSDADRPSTIPGECPSGPITAFASNRAEHEALVDVLAAPWPGTCHAHLMGDLSEMEEPRPPYQRGGLAEWVANATEAEIASWVRTRPVGLDPDGADESLLGPEETATLESIASGLVNTEDDRWLDRDDAIDELGARQALRALLFGELMHRDWLRRRGLLPGDDGPRLGEMVERIAARLGNRRRTWLKAGTLAEMAGRKNLTDSFLAQVADVLALASIHHHPAVLTHCRPTDTILLSTDPIHDPGLPFESERRLSRFVMRHYRQLEPFSDCTSVRAEVPYPYSPHGVRIDLLFRDKGRDYIVCELEHGDGGLETGSQITLYMEAVLDSLPPGADVRVRGVVVSGAPNERQLHLIEKWLADHPDQQIDWYTYRLALDLEAQPLRASTPG